MPTVRDLRCTINTPGGAMIEYLPPPEDPLDPTTPYHPDTPNTHTRYVSITGCENERLYIKLNGTSEFRWSEGLCTKITADFYIDGVLVGSRPYYEHFENGRPPSIVFGAVKTFEVEMAGGDYRGVEKKASLTFKEMEFAEQRPPNDTIPPLGMTDPLGEISIKVYRHRGGYFVQRYQHELQPRNPQRVAPAMASERILTERDVKGRGIQYLIATNLFQEAIPRQRVYQDDIHRGQLVTRIIDMEMVDPYHRPYVCFRFLYRTRAHLEGLGLIPYTDKDSIKHQLPYKSSQGGGVKRKREDGSPSDSRVVKIERGGEPIKLSDSDDDELAVLEEMPPGFRQRKTPSLFKSVSHGGKGKGKADPGEESLFLPFESGSVSPAPPTPRYTRFRPEKDPDFRIVYTEDSDGIFVAIREPVTPAKQLIFAEDEAGDFKQVDFGADSKQMPMGVGLQVNHPSEASSMSRIHEGVNLPRVNAGSTSAPQLQSTFCQNQERDFIGFDEVAEGGFIGFDEVSEEDFSLHY